MENKDYSVFTITDFLEDADFLRFVKYKYPNDVAFWLDWRNANPQNLKSFTAAELQLKLILGAEEFIPSPNLEVDLLEDIKQSIGKNQRIAKLRRRNYYWASGIAASLFIGVFAIWFFNSIITYKADYGETTSLTLPDGTEIKLNSNSSLSYPRAYAWKKTRTVKLTGEAYFQVKHLNRNPQQIKDGERFQAETGSLEVEVLGTEFNLKERHGEAHVALIRGKVRVKSIKTGNKYMMQPGNVIKINAADGALIADNESSAVKTAWTEGKLIVNQTSVKEIITAFEDLYGYKVILDNPALSNKKIDGSISIKSEQSLLFTLSNILDVNIKREGKVIRLESRR
ncbi:FecR family protein [Pedobacter aquatilis]|uniref:FecR family protein n=1 Tax=Pedobacter aquatilis TaxID=351343 RepID=UPI0029318DA9|nr:FecR domain-containing protein [Pedobacter aquatilis]